MKIYLAVGHGLKPNGTYDPGAAGNGWTEQDAGDVIVAEAAKLLRSWGATVKDESYQDDPNYRGTVRLANKWKADYVVAVHHDWIKAPSGAFGFWISSAGKALADAIQEAVGQADFPLRSSWHKKRTDLYVINNTKAPCVLYECGRIGDSMLNEPHELRNMGKAIAEGIAGHVGLQRTIVTLEKEDNDMAHLSEDDQKWLAAFVAEGRKVDARPTSLWHVLKGFRDKRSFFSKYFK